MPDRDRDIIIEDPTLAAGFTQIPNQVLRRTGLSPGAKLAYVMLLSYAWQDGACFPGQETLARDMSVTDRSVRTYLKELQQHGLITIRQRGLNLTNLYVLHRLGSETISSPNAGPETISDQDRKQTPPPDRKSLPTTKKQSTNTQHTNEGKTNGSTHEPPPAPLDPRSMTLVERIAWTEERERNRKAIAQAERAMLGGRQ